MNQRPIVFGPGDKLAWLEGIAFDARLSPFDARLAIALTNRIDKHAGTITIGQQWLADKINGSERWVRKSLERLATCGHLAVQQHSKGRGRANVYRPIKTGTVVPLFGEEKRNSTTLKEEFHDIKRGTTVPPLPNNYQNSTYRPNTDSSPNHVLWLAVKDGLAAHFGADVEAAWFGNLTVEAITPAEVVLCVPTAFRRRTLEDRYSQRLLMEWRRVVPTIESVRLVLPIARAAE